MFYINGALRIKKYSEVYDGFFFNYCQVLNAVPSVLLHCELSRAATNRYFHY